MSLKHFKVWIKRENGSRCYEEISAASKDLAVEAILQDFRFGSPIVQVASMECAIEDFKLPVMGAEMTR